MEMMGNKIITSALFVLLFAFHGWSKEVPPKPKQLVNDYANILSSNEVSQLENRLVKYDETTSTQIAVVILKSLDGDDIFDYSQRLAESWGIGGAENNNGVLMLISIDDRKLRIHTGYGTEGAIPDAIAKRIIENEIKPAFKANQYAVGINAGIDAMEQALAGEYKGTGKKDKKGFPWASSPS
jgi:uncharacterized protein